jgi:hypothetical protein
MGHAAIDSHRKLRKGLTIEGMSGISDPDLTTDPV